MRARIVWLIVAAVAACGQPAGLDQDEAVASARTCASLLERAAARRDAAGDEVLEVGGEKLDLFGDPEGFYRFLAAQRSPRRSPCWPPVPMPIFM